MEVYDCLRSRVTVREFKPDPVPDKVINKMLRAARWAPNSRNRQPWHFIVIWGRCPGTIGSIASAGSLVSRAPLGIAIVMDNANRPELDAGRALQ